MQKLMLCLAAFAALVLVNAGVQPALAQSARTWVSGVGDDTNPCSRTAPCLTFAGAISKTTAGGEIDCLDPGGFGAVTITKSISIICDNVEAGVLVSGTNGITISAGTTDVVYLSGLDIEGQNTSLSGVQVDSAGTVSVVNCTIRGFNTAGVRVTNSTAGVRVNIIDTIIADNAGEGIFSKPAGSVGNRLTIDHTRVSNSGGDGIMVNATATSAQVKASIADSKSMHNGADGIVAFSAGSVADVMVDTANVSDNNRGINSSGAGAIIRFTHSTIHANGTGVNQVGAGQAVSYGTNGINGNGAGGNGTWTSIATQ